MDKKRERGKNYTDTEKDNLINIVARYLHIVENKKTDIKTIQEKNAVWQRIVKEFCVVSQTGDRTVAQLKMLYEGLKKKAKKDKKESHITADGKTDSKLSNISLKILSLLENKMADQSLDIIPKTEPVSTTNVSSVDANCFKIDGEDEFNNMGQTENANLKNEIFSNKMSKRKLDEEYYLEKRKVKIDILFLRKEREQHLRDITLLEKREKEIDVMIKEEYLNQLKTNIV